MRKHFFDYLDKAEEGQIIIIQRNGHKPVKLAPLKEEDWRDKMTIIPQLLVDSNEAFMPVED